MKKFSSYTKSIPTLQAKVEQTRIAVQNTWYTILSTTANVTIYSLAFRMDTANEDIEVELTIDGNTFTASITAVANTTYVIYLLANPIASSAIFYAIDTQAYAIYRAYLTKGRSIQVRIRKTTAAGANALRNAMVYGVE